MPAISGRSRRGVSFGAATIELRIQGRQPLPLAARPPGPAAGGRAGARLRRLNYSGGRVHARSQMQAVTTSKACPFVCMHGQQSVALQAAASHQPGDQARLEQLLESFQSPTFKSKNHQIIITTNQIGIRIGRVKSWELPVHCSFGSRPVCSSPVALCY